MCPDNCEPCAPIIVPCTDCPPPVIVSPCLNGELCVEITWAECVQYRGENLTNINVQTNDRLDDILRKLNLNHTSTGVVVEDTDSVDLSGTGLNSDKLKADVRIDPIAGNLLEVSAAGLKVKHNQANVLVLFDLIENDPVLQARFCELVGHCSASACGIPTSVVATMI